MASTVATGAAAAGTAGPQKVSPDRFASHEDLHKWLVREQKVDAEMLGKSASLLFEKGYITKGSLLNITVEMLNRAGIRGPLAKELRMKQFRSRC